MSENTKAGFLERKRRKEIKDEIRWLRQNFAAGLKAAKEGDTMARVASGIVHQSALAELARMYVKR